MKITQDVRDYAATKGLSEADALAEGMAAKSAEFKAAGGAFYVPVQALNRKT
jgi:phosphomethylpyrimidine synthase